jgi:hypothetical protein
MRQTISAVIEHTTKEVLEARARDCGMPLSRYIRKVLEQHENTPYVTKAEKAAEVRRIESEYDNA